MPFFPGTQIEVTVGGDETCDSPPRETEIESGSGENRSECCVDR